MTQNSAIRIEQCETDQADETPKRGTGHARKHVFQLGHSTIKFTHPSPMDKVTALHRDTLVKSYGQIRELQGIAHEERQRSQSRQVEKNHSLSKLKPSSPLGLTSKSRKESRNENISPFTKIPPSGLRPATKNSGSSSTTMLTGSQQRLIQTPSVDQIKNGIVQNSSDQKHLHHRSMIRPNNFMAHSDVRLAPMNETHHQSFRKPPMKKKLKKVIVNKQVFSLKQTQALTSAKSPEANQVSDEIVDIRGRIGSSITKRVEPSG